MGLMYLASEYRRSAVPVARRLVFLTIVLSSMVYLSGIWPVMSYFHTAQSLSAAYVARLNGPITAAQYASVVASMTSSGGEAVGLSIGSNAQVAAAGRQPVEYGGDLYLYDPGCENAVQRLLLGDALVLRGSMSGSDACALDIVSAKRLKVRIGDTIEFSQLVTANDGAPLTLHGAGVVRAIYGTNADVRGLIAPLPTAQRAGAGGADVAYTDIFFYSANSDETLARLSSITSNPEWTIQSRSQAVAIAERRAVAASGPQFRTTALIAGLLIYAVYVLREQFVRIGRRRRAVAIMFSMGSSIRSIIGLMIAEQIAICVATGIAGLLIGKLLIESTLGMYIPAEATTTFVLWLVGLNVAALCILAAQLAVTFKRFPVARLLSLRQEY
ncbi:MAG: hypothetical protein Q8S43_03505 [Actinomycetota bacterium]|nr:MAG: hypothetical protein FD171_189 [Actinomycetota bacterium]MDO8949492.1 hypothetical protein [Actinomycetota bacterium]MDP3630002.1 hypothetical protein [Actinomycetota bacterium]